MDRKVEEFVHESGFFFIYGKCFCSGVCIMMLLGAVMEKAGLESVHKSAFSSCHGKSTPQKCTQISFFGLQWKSWLGKCLILNSWEPHPARMS